MKDISIICQRLIAWAGHNKDTSAPSIKENVDEVLRLVARQYICTHRPDKAKSSKELFEVEGKLRFYYQKLIK